MGSGVTQSIRMFRAPHESIPPLLGSPFYFTFALAAASFGSTSPPANCPFPLPPPLWPSPPDSPDALSPSPLEVFCALCPGGNGVDFALCELCITLVKSHHGRTGEGRVAKGLRTACADTLIRLSVFAETVVFGGFIVGHAWWGWGVVVVDGDWGFGRMGIGLRET